MRGVILDLEPTGRHSMLEEDYNAVKDFHDWSTCTPYAQIFYWRGISGWTDVGWYVASPDLQIWGAFYIPSDGLKCSAASGCHAAHAPYCTQKWADMDSIARC